MSEPTPPESPPTVEQTIATFGDLDDAGLQQLLRDESAQPTPRVTLVAAIEAEQAKRKAAASEADEAAKAEADEKARKAGFADAATQKAAEDAAAKKAAEKPKASAAKKPAKAKAAGFDVPADGAERLGAIADEKGEIAVAIGDDTGPDGEIRQVTVKLGRNRGLVVNGDTVNFSAAGIPNTRRYTHVYATEGKVVISKRELASPVTLQPGEQLSFKAGSLAF